MPLLDHFHPPVNTRRHWHAFHNSWATYLSSYLNSRLPQGYFAEANVQFGIEIDVATLEESAGATDVHSGSWHPPAPTLTVPFSLTTDIVEIAVFQTHAGPTLAGAIELVSPANKDRPAHRAAFVAKCARYLQEGIGLIVVDVVTERTSNLHAELLRQVSAPVEKDQDLALFAGAYRPVKKGNGPLLDIWLESLHLGQSLPTLPLWLRGGICLAVDFEETYERTRAEQRVN